MSLTFQREPHEYRLDGARVPSVTEVLQATGVYPDFSRIDPYYAQRGSAAHRAIALDLLGRLDESSVAPEIELFLARARRFIDLFDLLPAVVEKPLACAVYRYAGTPDLLAWNENQLVFVDWKTGHHHPGYEVQAAGGYLPLIEQAAERGEIPVDPRDVRCAKVAVVSLANEQPSPAWVKPDGQRDIFRAALAVYNWRRAHC